MGASTITLRGTLPDKQNPAPLELGSAGASVQNVGPQTVYYRDELPVTASAKDGSIAPNGSVILSGTQYVVVDEGAAATATDIATLLINPVAPTTGEGNSGSSGTNPLNLKADGTDGSGNLSKLNAYIASLTTNGRIVLPAGDIAVAGVINRGAHKVDIVGQGEEATTLRCTVDTAAPASEDLRGHFIHGGWSASLLADMTIKGPGNDPALGTRPAQISGVKAGDRHITERCYITRFCHGVNVVGNHQVLTNVKSSGNYTGMYFGPGGATFGDQRVDHVDLTGNKLASLAISGDNMLDSASVDDLHLGFSPIGILLEAKASKEGAISNSVMSDVAFEACGERLIYAAGTVAFRGGIKKTTTGAATTLQQLTEWPLPLYVRPAESIFVSCVAVTAANAVSAGSALIAANGHIYHLLGIAAQNTSLYFAASYTADGGLRDGTHP